MSSTPNAASEESVEALIGDVRHVVENTEPTEWADIAAAVLEHHTPPIDETLLSMKSERLQHWCRELLQAMVVTDKDAIREAAQMVKRYS